MIDRSQQVDGTVSRNDFAYETSPYCRENHRFLRR